MSNRKKTPPESIVRTCSQTGEEFVITPLEIEFYEKNGIPLPDVSPEYRQQQRVALSRSRNLYKTKCSQTGTDILSVYPPDSPFPVYKPSVYWKELEQDQTSQSDKPKQ